MQETDGKTVYLTENVPYKGNFINITVFEQHSHLGELVIGLGYPVKDQEYRKVKHFVVNTNDAPSGKDSS